MSVEVRQARFCDRDAIAAFLNKAYSDSTKNKERWTWQFVCNPFGNHDAGLVPVWIAVEDGNVVGQIAVQKTKFQIDHQTYDAGWMVDVMILPSHRGRSIGHILHQNIPAKIPLIVTLTMAPATRRISEKAGCITLGKVRQFSKWTWLDADAVRRYLESRTVTRPTLRAYVRFACHWMQFHRAFPMVANPVILLREAVRRAPRVSGDIKFEEIDRFGDDLDELWYRVRGEYPVIVPRTSRFLNWRFVECPSRTYHRFLARRNGRTLGYVVLRRREPVELPEGVIVDIFASRHDAETITGLLGHGLLFFGRSVAVVDCAASAPEYEAVLRQFGFFVTRRHHPTCVSFDAALRTRLRTLKNQGFFTKADHDWDQPPSQSPRTAEAPMVVNANHL